jgi:hypothetical protein
MSARLERLALNEVEKNLLDRILSLLSKVSQLIVCGRSLSLNFSNVSWKKNSKPEWMEEEANMTRSNSNNNNNNSNISIAAHRRQTE